MPTAALADIHGNVQALDAVLADPRLAAAAQIVVLGDIVAGTFPTETFDRLAALGDRVRLLCGNADRLVLDGDGEESRWVRDRLGLDRLSTVKAWPPSFAIDVERLGAVFCCHATPRDDEEILTRITPEADLAAALEGTDEPVVIGGHTHVQFDRRAGRRRFVNVGSIGRPYEDRPGAYWALLGPDVELLRTEYDVGACEGRRDVVNLEALANIAGGKQFLNMLLHPPGAEAAAVEWEAMRGAP